MALMWLKAVCRKRALSNKSLAIVIRLTTCLAYEKNTIPKIKAGVLSEDAVWDMLDDVNNVIKEMKEIVK